MSENIKSLIKCFAMDRPGHFQLTPSLAMCDWSGTAATFEKIKVNSTYKIICTSCRKKVTGDGEFSDLYSHNDPEHLGPTRADLHMEGRTKYARDLYVYQDKRAPKKRKCNSGEIQVEQPVHRKVS